MRAAASASTSRPSCAPPPATASRSPPRAVAVSGCAWPRARSAPRATVWTAAGAASPSPPRHPQASSTACRPCANCSRRPSRRTPCSPAPGWSRAARSRTPPLPLARRHARRLPALLHRRPGQALHRPARPLQDQQTASAPQRRPGLAHRHRLLAAPGDVRRLDPGRRRPRRPLHQGRLQGDRPVRVLPLPGGRPRDRHARPHQRRPRLVRRAELRRRRAPSTPAPRSASARCASARTSRTTSWTT